MKFRGAFVPSIGSLAILMVGLIGEVLTETNTTFEIVVPPQDSLPGAAQYGLPGCYGDYFNLPDLGKRTFHEGTKAKVPIGKPAIGNGYELQCMGSSINCALYEPSEITCEIKPFADGSLYRTCRGMLKSFLRFGKIDMKCQPKSKDDQLCVYRDSCVLQYTLESNSGSVRIWIFPCLGLVLTVLFLSVVYRRWRYSRTSVVRTATLVNSGTGKTTFVQISPMNGNWSISPAPQSAASYPQKY